MTVQVRPWLQFDQPMMDEKRLPTTSLEEVINYPASPAITDAPAGTVPPSGATDAENSATINLLTNPQLEPAKAVLIALRPALQQWRIIELDGNYGVADVVVKEPLKLSNDIERESVTMDVESIINYPPAPDISPVFAFNWGDAEDPVSVSRNAGFINAMASQLVNAETLTNTAIIAMQNQRMVAVDGDYGSYTGGDVLPLLQVNEEVVGEDGLPTAQFEEIINFDPVPDIEPLPATSFSVPTGGSATTAANTDAINNELIPRILNLGLAANDLAAAARRFRVIEL